MMPLMFVDTETTGLDPAVHVPWEVAAIEADGTEHTWRWRPNLLEIGQASAEALRINRFADRAPEPYDPARELGAAHEISDLLAGTIMVGSNPDFDRRMLEAWLGWHNLELTCHYRTIDVATMAAGWLSAAEPVAALPDLAVMPWKSYELSRAIGVDPPDADAAHTALGDARWVRRMWQTLTA